MSYNLQNHPAAARHARDARPLSIGTLRPNIVLFDELHPHGELIGALSTHDMMRKPDVLIVMGMNQYLAHLLAII